MSDSRYLAVDGGTRMTGVQLDGDQLERIVRSRDARFDGCFVLAIASTGIYCRPSCPAPPAKRANMYFFPTAAAAQARGFRACKRCRPDVSPGSPEWNVRSDVVGRAMRLISDGIVDREGVGGLAARLGYSERQLNRLLTAELGTGAHGLARAQRAQSARTLIETTTMPFTRVAFAAGFGSVRQFNDVVREVFAATPSEMRSRSTSTDAGRPGVVRLRLAYREPYDTAGMWEFLAARAIDGVESLSGDLYGPAVGGAQRERRLLGGEDGERFAGDDLGAGVGGEGDEAVAGRVVAPTHDPHVITSEVPESVPSLAGEAVEIERGQGQARRAGVVAEAVDHGLERLDLGHACLEAARGLAGADHGPEGGGHCSEERPDAGCEEQGGDDHLEEGEPASVDVVHATTIPHPGRPHPTKNARMGSHARVTGYDGLVGVLIYSSRYRRSL